MVYVWYPATETKDGQSAQYMLDFASIQEAVGEPGLNSFFRPALSAIQQAGYPKIHAVENAKILSSANKYPVLVFSHGLGMVSSVYTAALEDLASHGYVIAAIDHTYDTAFTAFPDGRLVTYAREKWRTESEKPGGFLSYVKDRIEVWAIDTHFVIDQLIRYNDTTSLRAPFAGHLDFQRVGAFGHSVGGLASGRAAQIDSRIRACIDQDSDINGSPFIVDTVGSSLEQPFLFLIGPTSDLFSERKLHPTDERLASWKLTRTEYDSIVQKQQKIQNEVLARVKGGSYRVALVDLPDFTHRSFTDLELLAADVSTKAASLHNFRTIQLYMRAFFDKYLKSQKGTILDQNSSNDPRVRVEKFKLGSDQSQSIE
jgi:pimeloyl-ACP methyl ester carboxylesterase